MIFLKTKISLNDLLFHVQVFGILKVPLRRRCPRVAEALAEGQAVAQALGI